MIEKFFKQGSKVLSQLKANSLGSSLDYYAEYLNKQCRSHYTPQYYLRVAGHFNYWLKTKHISLDTVNETTVDKFISKHLKKCSCPIQKASFNYYPSALRYFLKVLRENRLIPLLPKPKLPSVTPIDKLLHDFSENLEKVSGIAPTTISTYLTFIRAFLKTEYKNGPIDLKRLNVYNIREYISVKADIYKTKSIWLVATSLRAFFRFLKMTNQINQPLENAVPTIARSKLSTTGIPRYLTEEQLQRLLSSFKLSRPVGLRDLAIALLMVRLGLRVGEVTQIKLEDINWRQGTIQLRKTKSRHSTFLPLLKDVGEALAAYLQKGRPLSPERQIFLTHSLPRGRPLSRDGVRDVIRGALSSTLSITGGPHILRRTLATNLLQKNAKLKEIADVLRHRNIETTNIYARVDLRQLSEVALPWPEIKS